jgi:Xaa-Pro dipeptidase
METTRNNNDFTIAELTERVRKLQRHLADKDIGLAVLTQNSDLYYYTGSVQPLYLLVPADGEPLVLARKAITRIQDEITHIRSEAFSGTKDLTAILDMYGPSRAERIGLTLDVVSYSTVTRLMRLFPNAEIADLSWDIRTLRAAKSDAEIAIQARAGEVMVRVPEIVREAFRPGMTEIELTAALEHYLRLSGHGIIRFRREGIEAALFGVLSSGVNSLAGTKFDGISAGVGVSPAVPYGASSDPITHGAPVIIDFALVLSGYHVDQTRMLSWGEPSDEVLNAYDAMLRVEDAIIGALKPGKPWEDVYNMSVDMASDLGYAETFMGSGTERVKFVGHGVGLELDEPPYLAPGMAYPLEAGMVIALEPKVALPGIGVIGIEDTVAITDSGVRVLTTCAPDFIVVD